MDRTLSVVAACLATTACAVSMPGAGGTAPVGTRPAGAAEGTPCSLTPEQTALERVNAVRLERGLRPLAAEAALAQAATAHSADQAAQGESGVGHVGSDGSAPGERVSAAGYDWVLVAENVAAGIASPLAVVAGWMESPPHRATILSPDALHAGFGHVHRPDGRLDHYWTLVVAAPRDPGATRPLACHP